MKLQSGSCAALLLAVSAGLFVPILSGCSSPRPFPGFDVAGGMTVVEVRHSPARTLCVLDDNASQRFVNYLASTYPQGWTRPHYFVSLAPTYRLESRDGAIEVLEKGIVIRRKSGQDAVVHSIEEGRAEVLITIACGQGVVPASS